MQIKSTTQLAILAVVAALVCLIYVSGGYARNNVGQSVTSDQASELRREVRDSYTKWRAEHSAKNTAKTPHVSFSLATQRTSTEGGLVVFTVNSNDPAVLSDIPDIEVLIQTAKFGETETAKKLGGATQLRIAKTTSKQASDTDTIAAADASIFAEEEADALEITVKLIGKHENKVFVHTMGLDSTLRVSSVGASNSAPTSESAASSLKKVNYLLAKAKLARGNTMQGCCQSITVSCSCSGCPGCSRTKNCKSPGQACGGGPIMTTCNPREGTCNLSCSEC